MLISFLRDSRIQAASESVDFPPCSLPPTPIQPKCPPCFDPEPLPAEEPAPNMEAVLGSDEPVVWKKPSPSRKPSPSSSDCWQWCGSWQSPRWTSYQRGYNSSSSRTSWHRSDYNWYSWRNWGCSCWQSGVRCWCWQRRREKDRYPQRHRSLSVEARWTRELPACAQMADLLFREITPNDYELLLQLDEEVARPTVSKNDVDSLPQVRVEQSVGERCMVCLDNFRFGENVSLLPSCRHHFHRDCIAKWLLERHRVCPLCSVEVFPTQQ